MSHPSPRRRHSTESPRDLPCPIHPTSALPPPRSRCPSPQSKIPLGLHHVASSLDPSYQHRSPDSPVTISHRNTRSPPALAPARLLPRAPLVLLPWRPRSRARRPRRLELPCRSTTSRASFLKQELDLLLATSPSVDQGKDRPRPAPLLPCLSPSPHISPSLFARTGAGVSPAASARGLLLDPPRTNPIAARHHGRPCSKLRRRVICRRSGTSSLAPSLPPRRADPGGLTLPLPCIALLPRLHRPIAAALLRPRRCPAGEQHQQVVLAAPPVRLDRKSRACWLPLLRATERAPPRR